MGYHIEPNYRNYVIDVLILASFLACAATGIIKWPGFLRSRGLDPAALPMERITALHDWAGLLMIGLIAVHFILHMGWLAAMTKRMLGIESRINKKA